MSNEGTSHHLKDPYRGAGNSGVLGLKAFGLFARQQSPEVQLASEPVAYPINGDNTSDRYMTMECNIRRTRIEMKIRDVQHLQPLAARLFRGWERTGFWLCKPASQVQRGSRRQGAQAKKILTEELRWQVVRRKLSFKPQVEARVPVHQDLQHQHWRRLE
jgi:hypothetical protein